MKEFVKNKTYCLHNTGNDFQAVFFSKKNEDYFKAKINKFIAPFAEIVHVSLYFNQFFIVIHTKKNVDLTLLRKNIGIMVGSYVRGVNVERKRLGSLFRKGTKAYQHFSEFPSHIKEVFQELRQFLAPSRVVNFMKSAKNFFASLDEYLFQGQQKYRKLKLHQALKHPLEKQPQEYLDLVAAIEQENSKSSP